jgi:hypothetical protein
MSKRIKSRKFMRLSAGIGAVLFTGLVVEQALRTLEEIAQPVRRLNVVWVVIAPGRSHTFGLDVIGDNVLAVSKRLVTYSAVSFLSGDFLGEHFPQF